MKNFLNLLFVAALCFTACSEDPCDTENNLECDTQDFDMDGVLNGDDEAPQNACVPNQPAFNDLVVGTWDWSVFTESGTIEILADGTYNDIVNELVSTGEVAARDWSTEGETLELETTSTTGLKASITLVSTSVTCNRIVFDSGIQGFDIVFARQ